MKIDRFFTDEEKIRIRECVRRAEAGTSGEIAPMVVERSADYTGPRLMTAVLGALVVACIWLLVRPLPHPLWLLVAEGVGFSTVLLLLKASPKLLRFMVHESVIENAVRDRARLAFFDHGLYQTRDRTGVLILISVLERQVQILADKGINQKVPQSTWNDLVRRLIAGIQRKQAAEALCETIETCGRVLSEHFPPRPDDRDELANQVIAG